MPKPKVKELTPEEIAEEAAAKLKKQQAEDQQDFNKALAKHNARCDRWRPLWDGQIARIMAQEAKEGSLSTARTYDQIAAELAQEAKDDVESLDREIFGLVTRSGMVFSATTLLFAVFALRSNNGKLVGPTVAAVLLTTALLFAAIAFVSALVPFWTRILRAWREPYHPRAFTTLLRNSSYDRWVWYTWLGDRRTPVSQKYKKAHSVVVPMLIGAAILIVPGLGLSLFFT